MLFVKALWVALRQHILGQWGSDDGSRILCETARRGRQRHFGVVDIAPVDGIDLRKIRITRCIGMIGLIESEKPPRHGCARFQDDWWRLHCYASDFMLQATAGQAVSEVEVDLVDIAIGRTEELHRIGRKGFRAVEAAMHDPWMLASLRDVLAAHDNGSEARVPSNVMVDVLRSVGFVVGEESAGAEADVLHENGV